MSSELLASAISLLAAGGGLIIPPPPGDLCHARAAASLIGHPISDMPKPRHGYSHRFVCTTCEVSLDYSPRRLNIIFDKKTGKITALQCG